MSMESNPATFSSTMFRPEMGRSHIYFEEIWALQLLSQSRWLVALRQVGQALSDSGVVWVQEPPKKSSMQSFRLLVHFSFRA